MAGQKENREAYAHRGVEEKEEEEEEDEGAGRV